MTVGQEVHFTRVPIGMPCPVPVLPGTGDTMRDGEPIPMEERTEKCCVDAYWIIGAQLCCDIHVRIACDLLDVDFDGLCQEADIPLERAHRAWGERTRYAQDDPALSFADDVAEGLGGKPRREPTETSEP